MMTLPSKADLMLSKNRRSFEKHIFVHTDWKYSGQSTCPFCAALTVPLVEARDFFNDLSCPSISDVAVSAFRFILRVFVFEVVARAF